MPDPEAFVRIGQTAPAFSAPDQDGNPHTLGDLLAGDRWLVLYFYPRDNTPGCTAQAREFTALSDRFAELKAQVVGVSPDSVKKHGNFRDKHQLTVTLLSDPERELCKTYGVWQLKKFMGRESMGVVRSTVLIAPSGIVAQAWFQVRAKGHAAVVLEALADLQASGAEME